MASLDHVTCKHGLLQPQEIKVAEKLNFADLSVDELWSLHEEICALLSSRINEEKRQLERRLAILNRGADPVRDFPAPVATESRRPRRKYPEVVPRYRNPETSETWSGRGKQPRWLVAAIKAGQRMEDFLIHDAGPLDAAVRESRAAPSR
jgi:DNA-binding protein H-NS